MRAIGKQVDVGTATDDLGEAFAELALKKAHDLSYTLQRNPLSPQLADDRDLGQVLHRVQPAMSLALRLDHSALVPPLKLTGGDAS